MTHRKSGRLAWLAGLFGIAALHGGDGYRSSVGSGDAQYPVVVVRGTPYEMGKKQGELLRRETNELIGHFLTRVQTADPKRFSNENLDAAFAAIAPHTDPRFHDELKGIAEGTGLPLRTLQRATAMPVVADYSCSSIAAWGAATRNGHLYQTRNLDWEMNAMVQDYPCIVIYLPDKGIPHVNVTFAGCIGSNTGMNAAGIALSEMGDSPGREYPFDLNGTHFTTLFRTALYDAENLDGALAIFKSARRIKKYHYVVGDGKNRRAAKLLAHAPDLKIWFDNDPSDELAPNILRDVVYQDEGRGAFGPLQSQYGKIGHQEMIDLACKIPIKGGNVLDVVYDATALECWVSYAKKDVEAYKRPFVHVKLRDYFEGKAPQAN